VENRIEKIARRPCAIKPSRQAIFDDDAIMGKPLHDAGPPSLLARLTAIPSAQAARRSPRIAA
jgi:hypothetical protein